jgi:hypothetical protein
MIRRVSRAQALHVLARKQKKEGRGGAVMKNRGAQTDHVDEKRVLCGWLEDEKRVRRQMGSRMAQDAKSAAGSSAQVASRLAVI